MSAYSDQRKPTRIRELDALRGIAALMVVLFHFTTQYDGEYGHSSGYWLSFGIGRQGVELFFMISGFVIFMSLERSRGGREFALARARRLFPAYWVSMLLTAGTLAVVTLPGHEVSLIQVVVNLTMVQAFVGVRHVDAVYWTLSFELAFYGWMLLAFKVGAIRRFERTLLMWSAATIAVMFIGGGLFRLHLPYGVVVITLVRYANLFAAGALFYRLRVAPSRATVALLGLTLAAELLLRPHSVLVVAVWYATFVLLINDRLTFLRVQPLLFLGSISYPLYLLHNYLGFVVIRQLYDWGVEGTVPLVLIPLLFFIALATTIHLAVEGPAQRLWRRSRPVRPEGEAHEVERTPALSA